MKGIAPTKFEKLAAALRSAEPIRAVGKVSHAHGLIIEASGIGAQMGDLAWIDCDAGPLAAEVVGFRQQHTLLMPLGEMNRLKVGAHVRSARTPLRVPISDDLLGRIVDALGNPIDGKPPIAAKQFAALAATPPRPMERSMVEQPLWTGVRAIDALTTVGCGQRIGVFAGSGVGKSTLLGMIARSSTADVNVIALIGERGREVREFVVQDLGKEGLARSVVVCATSDEPPLLRIKAALAATSIAESFRDQGQNVMLLMDSVTRFAMAQREVGLAVGEPPSTKGYTPSTFALLPKLMERAGSGAIGTITAVYTVLVEGDDHNEPIADAVRSILDGHIVLSRKLANKGHFPAIDPLQSLSRTMPLVTSEDHQLDAQRVRMLLDAYEEVEDLISVGAYKEGTRPLADKAIANWDAMQQFLRQDRKETQSPQEILHSLKELARAAV